MDFILCLEDFLFLLLFGGGECLVDDSGSLLIGRADGGLCHSLAVAFSDEEADDDTDDNGDDNKNN